MNLVAGTMPRCNRPVMAPPLPMGSPARPSGKQVTIWFELSELTAPAPTDWWTGCKFIGMPQSVSIVCAWCSAPQTSPGEQVSHGICVACAMDFLKKLPREYLQSIAEPDGTVSLFSGHRLDIESGKPL